MNLKTISLLSTAMITLSAAQAFATPKCPGGGPGVKGNPKCGPSVFEPKVIEQIGQCVEVSALGQSQGGDKPAWFKKPKLHLNLDLVLDPSSNHYGVQATLLSRGTSINDLPYSPPPGKEIPAEMLEGRVVLKKIFVALSSNDPAQEVTLFAKGGYKIAISKADKQQAIDPAIADKPLESAVLYDVFMRYGFEQDQPLLVQMKCALVPSALSLLSKQSK